MMGLQLNPNTMNINTRIYDITKPSKQADNILANLQKCGVGHVVFRVKTKNNPFTGDSVKLDTIECITQRTLSNAEKNLIVQAVSRVDSQAVKLFNSQLAKPALAAAA